MPPINDRKQPTSFRLPICSAQIRFLVVYDLSSLGLANVNPKKGTLATPEVCRAAGYRSLLPAVGGWNGAPCMLATDRARARLLSWSRAGTWLSCSCSAIDRWSPPGMAAASLRRLSSALSPHHSPFRHHAEMVVSGHFGVGGGRSTPSRLCSRVRANSEEDTTATDCAADTVIKHRCAHDTATPFRFCFCYFCLCPICGFSSIFRTQATVGSSRRAGHGAILPNHYLDFVGSYAIRASWVQKYRLNRDAIGCFLML